MTKAQRIAQLKSEKPTPYTAPQRIQIKRYGDSYVRWSASFSVAPGTLTRNVSFRRPRLRLAES